MNCKCKYQNFNNCCMPENNEVNDQCMLEQKCSNVVNIDSINDCGCGFEENNSFPNNYMYGQSYVPYQVMQDTFIPCVALKMGTVFPELVSPYAPNQSVCENQYIADTNIIQGGCNQC